uniref:Uncharacterized protein n=1 Tax=Oryza punctata TaxID=4537 RepID=A0A0E0KFZ7_ORYPU
MGGGNSGDFFSATASFVFSRGFFSRAATPLRTPLTRQGILAMLQSSGDGEMNPEAAAAAVASAPKNQAISNSTDPTQEGGVTGAHTTHGRRVGDTRLGKEIAPCVSIHGQKFECIYENLHQSDT